MLFIGRMLLVLLAFLVGVLATKYLVLRGDTSGDAGLVAGPWLLGIIIVLVTLALIINDRFLQPRRPEPYWLKRRTIRWGIRLVVILAAGAYLFTA
jgi:hypothetical protein